MSRIFIHAPNIHHGGGRNLLLSLLNNLNEPITAILDERMEYPAQLNENNTILKIAPRIIDRLIAEYRLKILCTKGDVILCFGNLPPLFKNKAKVYVYLQNRYLLSNRLNTELEFLTRLRLSIERLWLRAFIRNATLLVQTKSMAFEVSQNLNKKAIIAPFYSSQPQSIQQDRNNNSIDYLYVASGEAHKNHRCLLEAWVILADLGVKPLLHLTLDEIRDSDTLFLVEEAKQKYDLNITNQTYSQETIHYLYKQSSALIYPSLFESFGLPLLEAADAGIPIIAPELDYVRDIVTPIETFDPKSPLSIARSILRHQGIPEGPIRPQNASDFLNWIYLENNKDEI